MYQLRAEINLLHLRPRNGEDGEMLHRVCARQELWDARRPVPVKVVEWDGPGSWVYADVAYFDYSCALCLSPFAQRCLSDTLKGQGYFADTDFLVDGQPYRLFFPMQRLDIVDIDRSDITRFPNGDVWEVYRTEIKTGTNISEPLFTLEHRRCFIFVTGTFVTELTKNQLIGYKLTEIWSSEHGGVDLRLVERPPGMTPRQERVYRKRLQAEASEFLLKRQTRD
jgi:hypothetical protein